MGMFQSENGYIEKYFTVGDEVIVELLIDELNGMCMIYDVTEDEILHQKYEPRNEFEVNITLPLMKCVGEDDNTLVFTTNALALLTKKILRLKYGNETPISMYSTGYEAVDKLIANKGDTNKAKNKKEVGLDGAILDGETKKAILRTINFVKKRDLYVDMGCTLPGGILLFGEPGTGKSLMAEVIARESNYKFKFVCASELLGQYVGSSASNIRKIFDELKKENSILYIDEIDAVGSKRQDDDNSKEYRSALNQLLSCMSDPQYDKIVVMASTNIPEQLDPALTREGRFDLKVEIKKPDKQMRIDLFKLYVGKLKHDEDIDFELLADETDGQVGAFIATLCNFAGMRAVDEGCSVTTMEHILAELDNMTNNSLAKKKEEIIESRRIGF